MNKKKDWIQIIIDVLFVVAYVLMASLAFLPAYISICNGGAYLWEVGSSEIIFTGDDLITFSIVCLISLGVTIFFTALLKDGYDGKFPLNWTACYYMLGVAAAFVFGRAGYDGKGGIEDIGAKQIIRSGILIPVVMYGVNRGLYFAKHYIKGQYRSDNYDV